MPISTRDLSRLPDINALERITRSIAMLDAILSPEWEYRYFSFNSSWDLSLGERMASMRNGSGDEYFLLFGVAGAIMKGFAHESAMSPWSDAARGVWHGVFDGVPPPFAPFLREPAFNMGDATFCIWRLATDSSWHRGEIAFPDGEDPDGSARLLWALDGNPQTYRDYAMDYFEMDIEAAAVGEIFNHAPLTEDLVVRLNSERNFAELETDAEEIGYPMA
jgi:hypothetical protein